MASNKKEIKKCKGCTILNPKSYDCNKCIHSNKDIRVVNGSSYGKYFNR